MPVFLLTPLREGRLCRDRASGRRANFYSRPCGRGDGESIQVMFDLCNFYSRPCGRGDFPACGSSLRTGHFYSRPCGRGDCSGSRWPAFPSRFLLTPLREGRLFAIIHTSFSRAISTHAPAGGATIPGKAGRGDPRAISTHAPAGGATQSDEYNTICIPISTHAPAGGATPEILYAERQCAISTHAPAGGATASCCSRSRS